MKPFNSKLRLSSVIATLFVVAGCSDNDNNEEPQIVVPVPVPYTYQVTVTNLTHAQPLSPIAVALHNSDVKWWTIGEAASDALASLAESGSNEALLSDTTLFASATGNAPLAPGNSVTLAITVDDIDNARISVATMLVNTNDAFSGVNGVDLSSLEVGDVYQRNALVYDAGTEENTEAIGTIPGPADSGEGNSEGREDHNVVTLHPGVVTGSDGLTTSVLSADHKFDNPSVRISITRME
ncbi:spondin domain-containing protein [Alteromonas sp. A079]|uniref:spondin domain-containing protein n=1 Tax=Alteromonas sp. A079 TaxID=3410268 RepID=UPI003B9EA02C